MLLPKGFVEDYYRCTGNKQLNVLGLCRDFLFQHRMRFMFYYRLGNQTNCKLLKYFCKYKLFRFSRKYGIEIHLETKIGYGFIMGHPYNITISPDATIGRNVNILKGATIGANKGKFPGSPIIGDSVYIGLNATIIGGISVGDNVMIAPNAFVNRDIPSNSIVVGNPCIIIPKQNATSEYIYHKV
jgi:serine O-acetyltransferase